MKLKNSVYQDLKKIEDLKFESCQQCCVLANICGLLFSKFLYTILKGRRPFGVPVVIRAPQFGKPLASALQ
jgi:hypothetical protein